MAHTTVDIKPVPRADVAKAAIRDVRNLTSFVRGLVALADELGTGEDLRTFTKKEEQRLAEIQGAIRSREAELEQVAVDLVAKRDEASAKIEQLDAEIQASKVTLQNHANIAAKLIDDAKAEATRIVIEARDDARRGVADEVEKIKARLSVS